MNEDDLDAELLSRIGRGEQRAVREMVARKLPRLLALGQRMLGNRAEAEEVTQEAFVRIWKQAPHWQPGHARFDTWMHRVALNLCYDRLRTRRDEAPLDDALDVADPAALPDETLQAGQRSQRMAAALAALPVRQREAIVLQYYQGLSNIEAAALMDIHVEALESLLARARRKLKALLALEGKEEA